MSGGPFDGFPGLGGFAPHVAAGIRLELRRDGEQRDRRKASHGEWVLYQDRKTGGAPPPPARWPIYRLFCGPRGEGCRLLDLETGRVKEAGNLYAGFVRMARGGGIYVSPRPGVGLQGDSHPTIASRTPEWLLGQRSIVAGGEVGILGSRVVGHNDKTGHYLSRRNREQSGLPQGLFHPFTVDPKVWYKA